jgi:hypothetical protein
VRFFLRRPSAVIVFVVALAIAAGIAGGTTLFHHGSKNLPRYMATPDSDNGEAQSLAQLDAYWNARLTYPTGRFNAAWLRHAAAQADKIPSATPKGIYPSDAGTARSVGGASAEAPLQTGSPSVPLDTTSAVALGPAPEHMTGCSSCFDYGQTEGRINAFAVDPSTTTPGSIVAYAGTVGGGVWKTTNCCSAATTWNVTTDDPLISAISIDTLTIDPNDHNTIYAGTGDLNYGSFSMGSQGILKSTDGGAHWTVLGADVFGPAYAEPAGQFPQYDAVGKVRVDPNNSNNVVAGTKKGIFVSYDGGTNWTGPCAPSGFPTQRQDITGLELSNMGGFTRILAAVGVRGFASTVQYDLGQNGANGLYSATMPASGCPSFTSIASNANGFVFGAAVTGSPYTTGANLNAGSGDPYVNPTTGDQLGRVDIAVAPSDPNVIYAQVQSIAPNNNAGCGNANGCQLGVFASTDGGSTWSFMAGSQGGALRNCLGTNTSGNPGDYPQNWYDQGIAVDPNNSDRIFVDTYDVWLANRTGTSFTDMTCGYNGSSVANHVVHVDQHALAFVHGSSSTLLVGSDGGAFSTSNADTASQRPVARPTFVNMDNGLNTIEYYSGDISGNFANSPTPSAAGGAQDNAPSVVGFTSNPLTDPSFKATQWQLATGGDGFYARIDPVGTGFGPRYWVGNNSGGLARCAPTATNTCVLSGAGYSNARGGWGGDLQSFILPFDLFHGGTPGGDDCAAAGVPGGCGHLVAGTTRVWETVSGGNATGVSGSWYVTNNPATQNMTKGTLGNRSFINQVKYSPKWSSVAAVGTNDANYWIGFNLGTGTAGQGNWVDVTGGNTVLPNRPVLGVALDPSSPDVATETGYAAVGGFNANTPDHPGHVFQVSCSASCASFSWLDKSGNLPDIPVDSVIVNPNFPQQVFAGTDFGLYFTNNINAASPTWWRFDAGVPHAMIWDLQIDRGATTLSIWTRGRGAYVWTLPSGPVKQDQTIDFGPLPDKIYGDPDFTVSATASSGLPVSFAASGNCTVTGSTVHLTGPGSCTITASQAGDTDYNAAPNVPQTFSIGIPGIVGLDSIAFGAKNALIDSYDSSAGAYGASNHGNSARVFGNGPITLAGGTVNGNVRSAASSVTLLTGAVVSGDVTAGKTIANSGTIGGTATQNSPTEPLAPDAVSPCTPFSGTAGISGAGDFTYNAAGDLTVKGGGRTVTLAAGTYCFRNVSVGGGSTLRAAGPVVLVLDGALSVGGSSSLLTASSTPADLKIRSAFTGAGGVSIGGGATAYGTIYAPKTDISLGGGSVLYGSLLGKSLSLVGSASVHYDTH